MEATAHIHTKKVSEKQKQEIHTKKQKQEEKQIMNLQNKMTQTNINNKLETLVSKPEMECKLLSGLINYII